MRRILPLLFLLSALWFSGCTLPGGPGTSTAGYGSPGGSGRSGGAPRETMRLFTPMAESGTRKLSDADARETARAWSLKMQRLGNASELDHALSQSLATAQSKPAGSVAVERPGLRVTWGQMTASLEEMRRILPKFASRPEALAESFHFYRIGPDFGITGYYEPTLEASRTKSSKYNYPLYRLPGNVRKGVAYHTRNAIDRQGALAGKGLEIAWVTSETDAFFLHVQGSGRLRFADGSVTHVLYAGKNNRKYVSLGRVMKEQGLLAEGDVSMTSIRRVLDENPGRKAELFDTNPSYVFFREAADGPLGAMGRPLTPWASVAVDRGTLPLGSLLFLSVPLPDDSGSFTVPFHGVVTAQDTGGAIKGNRIDLFCGAGEFAAHTAGYLDTAGAVYLLVKK